jgi:hypothetical protein
MTLNGDGTATGQPNLTFNGNQFYINGYISITGTSGSSGFMSLVTRTTDPDAISGASNLYSKAPGAGGTGIYFKNSSDSDELVSRKKAITYGLIF